MDIFAKTAKQMAYKTNSIDLIPVRGLIEMSFFIPSYQRGYRWTKYEVEALLDDINEFDEENDGRFYCLQPLVVKKDEVGRWRVIDGQQRLTTIYLTLQILREKSYITEDAFRIVYERGTKIDKCSAKPTSDDSMEMYYLKSNYKNVQQWIDKNLNSDKKKADFITKTLDKTNFIWYNIDIIPKANEYDVFNNLNSGKISLTNAELVKALFLKNTEGENYEKELKQNLIAEEYDQMERRLREPEFWYFLSGGAEQLSSCINLLFELMYETDSKLDGSARAEIEKVGANKIFYYFDRKVSYDSFLKDAKRRTAGQQFNQVKEVWEDVQKYFHTIEGWYADAETYNLIGYLRAVGYSLKDIYREYAESKDKNEFKERLKYFCYKECSLPELEDELSEHTFDNFRYDTNCDGVRRLLLLFNIASLNLQKTDGKDKKVEITKFSFASFHTCKWNVEHISPNNAIWYDELQETKFAQKKNTYCSTLQQAEKGGKKLKDFENELGEEVFGKLDEYICVRNDSIMSLSNLTLLNEHDNKSVGCKSFKAKRENILRFQAEGYFVPACTLMVFTKGYTSALNKDCIDFWSRSDRNDYLKRIYGILREYKPAGYADSENDGGQDE